MADFDWGKAAEPDEAFDWSNAGEPSVPVNTPESGAPQTEPAEAPGFARDLLTTGLQGFFKGGSDELAGATAGARLAAAGPGAALVDKSGKAHTSGTGLYRTRRDSAREQLDEARKRLGFLPAVGSEIAGDVASDFVLSRLGVPGVATPAGQAVIGGLSGLLGNDADLTKGRGYGSALASTGLGAGLGYALPKLGQKLAGGKVAREGVDRAVKSARDMATEKAEKAIASKLGEYRSAVQSGSRDLEVILREAEQAAADGVGEAAEKARAFLQTPTAKALREKVLINKLESAPERIGEMAARRAELDALTAGKGAAIEQGAEALLEKPIRKQILPRALTYMSRTVPAIIGSGIGSAVGGPLGLIAGGAIGSGIGMAMGRPGTAIGNALKSPAVRKAGWELVEGGMTGAGTVLGGLGGAAAREAQRLEPEEEEDDLLAEYLAQRRKDSPP